MTGRNILLLAIACLAGLATSELLCRSLSCREAIGRYCGRDDLLAVVHGRGIYEADRDAHPDQNLEALILAENLGHVSRREPISDVAIDRELNLIISQFGDEKSFAKELESSTLSLVLLRRRLAENLRGRAWVETRITSELGVTEEECQKIFETQSEQFVIPQRFRASHAFLAAHDGTPDDQLEAKRKTIQAFAARIESESLAKVAMEASEDEATKQQGGDLGFFSATRVPPEFMAQVEKLRLGQITPPFQTNLGFHIVELTDSKPARRLSFEEARSEIAGTRTNEKRAAAVAALAEQLTLAEFRRRTP